MQKGIGITHESNTSHTARDGQDFGIKSIIYGSGLPPVLQCTGESQDTIRVHFRTHVSL